ncbi:ChaN family lipoprotein [Cyclobacterium sp. SYSU L10401]|uniref:ChaN family lipoprotein n=1 Tax=Cyclobacterium sp. SYSU L10401 TaxID=2678657 RepID=UPI0013D3B73D|nr:ChaN family lipoprotein [Cyclobacterium sp. SYSU L10401]
MQKSLILLFFCTLPYAINARQNTVHPWKIVAAETGETVELPAIIAAMDKAQILVFGEEHDDSITHVLQKKLYQGLIAKHKKVTLSLEMFERDVQLVMDEYLSGLITEAKLVEEGRAWSNYRDYAPLVNLAQEKDQLVSAANVPGRYANMVSRKGLGALALLDRKAKSYFALFQPPGKEDAYFIKFHEAMGEHAQHMGPRYFNAQLLRDATMAESILQSWRKNRKTKILHVTGRFHSDEGLGTVNELKQRKKNLRIITISSFPSPDFQNPDFKAIQSLADYIILTKPPGK